MNKKDIEALKFARRVLDADDDPEEHLKPLYRMAIALIDGLINRRSSSHHILDLELCRVVQMDDAEYILALQRAVCDLIHLAKENGLNDDRRLEQPKELIRCRVLQCGMAGACNGVGLDDHPCPLRRTT